MVDNEKQLPERQSLSETFKKLINAEISMSISRDTFLPGLAFGFAASAINSMVFAPLTYISTQSTNEPNTKQVIALQHYISRTYQLHGLSGFWKGNLKYMARLVPIECLNYAFKEEYRKFFLNYEGFIPDEATYLGRFALAGAATGITTTFITHPFNSILLRLNVDKNLSGQGTREFNGFFDCAFKTFKKNAFLGLYRGLFRAIQEAFFFRCIQFGFYDIFKYWWSGETETNDVPLYLKYLFAQTTTTIAAVVCAPMAFDYFTATQTMMMRESAVKALIIRAKFEVSTAERIRLTKLMNRRIMVAYLINSVPLALILVLFDELIKYKKEFNNFQYSILG